MNCKLSICALFLFAFDGRRPGGFPCAHGLHAGTRARRSTTSAAGKPVARVNGSVLTDADLVREEYAIFPYARQHNGIPKDLAPQIRDGALKMIIFEELVYQEALRRKMTVPAAKMQRAEADFRKTICDSRRIQCVFAERVSRFAVAARGEDPALAADR